MAGRRLVESVPGPLAAFAVGYDRWLTAQGLCPRAVRDRIWQLSYLSEWLVGQGLSPGELDRCRAKEHVAGRRAAGCLTWVASSSLRLPLEYLREIGVLPVETALPAGPVDRLIVDYREYLLGERRLAIRTVEGCERVARVFLEDRERRHGALELGELSAGDVSEFLARECLRLSDGGTRGMVAKLRPLLVFLHVSGRVSAPLRWAVPGVANVQGRMLPRAVDRATVLALLASCDRRRVCGLRDYAIVLLLARLGLRCGEVAAIRLEDIDWRAGEILVRGKGGRRDRLPLPVDVGKAVTDYLLRRPPTESRSVFMRMPAPAGSMTRQSVSQVVVGACRRASVPRVAAHRLRHTAATEMLRAGGSLPEIAQVLRHQRLRTTAIYTRVDHAALRTVAMPWPGGDAA